MKVRVDDGRWAFWVLDRRGWEEVVTPRCLACGYSANRFSVPRPWVCLRDACVLGEGVAVLSSALLSLEGCAPCQRWGHAVLKALRRQKLAFSNRR